MVDQPDHYVANIQFADSVTASFSMEAFTGYHGRRTRIFGAMGDIVGDMEELTVTDFRTGKQAKFKDKVGFVGATLAVALKYVITSPYESMWFLDGHCIPLLKERETKYITLKPNFNPNPFKALSSRSGSLQQKPMQKQLIG